MESVTEVKSSFINAAFAGKWSSGNVIISQPYILYITPCQGILKTFIEELVTEVTATDYLTVDHSTANTLEVRNLKGEVTVITIRDSLSSMRGIRSRGGKRPAVLLGTDLVHSDQEQELVFKQFLYALSPSKRIVDLGAAYDARIN
jgi:hypothetical protein